MRRRVAALVVAAACTTTALARESLPLVALPTGDVGALLAVDLQIDGRASRWLIDTGSSRHLVSPAFARRLALSERGRVTADTAFGRIAGAEVDLPPLRFGSQTLPAGSALVLDLQRLAGAAADDIDGVIGAPWLDGHGVRFDFVGWTVGIVAAGEPCAEGWHELALQRHRGVPVLQLRVDGADEPALFDTGNAAALVRVDARAAAEPRGVALPGGTTSLARAGLVTVGPLARRDAPVAHLHAPALRAAMPPGVGTLAGVALFDGARIVLDMPRRRACVEPGTASVPGGFGLMLERHGERLVVGGVLDGSPAAAAGLMAGDTIVGWNGSVPASVAAAWSAVRGRDELSLTVDRPGASPRTLALKRAWFLPPLPSR